MNNMVPGFILKLWKMINDPQCDDLISWSEDGQSFIILDPPRFSQELSKYFKHNNISSFIRQLNMYGFKKVSTIENSGLHPLTDDLHFYHPDFTKDHPDQLEAIKRKLPQKLSENVDLRNVYKGITEIEHKQQGVEKTLSDIKKENEMLWAELHDLRQQHQQQQLYINKLMSLVFEAMEKSGIKTNRLPTNKRSSPLMIEGVEDPHVSKKARLTPQNDYISGDMTSIPVEQQQQQQIATTSYQIPQSNEPQSGDNDVNALFQEVGIIPGEVQSEQIDGVTMYMTAPLEGADDPNARLPFQSGCNDVPLIPTTSCEIPNDGVQEFLASSKIDQVKQSVENNDDHIDDLAPSIVDFGNVEFDDSTLNLKLFE